MSTALPAILPSRAICRITAAALRAFCWPTRPSAAGLGARVSGWTPRPRTWEWAAMRLRPRTSLDSAMVEICAAIATASVGSCREERFARVAEVGDGAVDEQMRLNAGGRAKRWIVIEMGCDKLLISLLRSTPFASQMRLNPTCFLSLYAPSTHAVHDLCCLLLQEIEHFNNCAFTLCTHVNSLTGILSL
jgi:hypothetical protein